MPLLTFVAVTVMLAQFTAIWRRFVHFRIFPEASIYHMDMALGPVLLHTLILRRNGKDPAPAPKYLPRKDGEPE
jgi:hypothetical protein